MDSRALTPELTAFCSADPRVVLVPGEHLHAAGVTPAAAHFLQEHHRWSSAKLALLAEAFRTYWERTARLATRCPDWSPPRRRNLAIVHTGEDVVPYAQLLNTSCWTLYDADVAPETSDVEWLAYLLVHGDRMARTGEVTQAAVRNAAYWFERSATEVAAFRNAATRSTRPDADAFRLLADHLDDLRRLADSHLRPPQIIAGYRPIPGSGLLVPPAQADLPPHLVQRWTAVAHDVVQRQRQYWSACDPQSARALCSWLVETIPPVLITARGRIVWDPRHPERLGALRSELRPGTAAAMASIHIDLEVAAAKTRLFRAALVDPQSLPKPDPRLAQSGYVFLHRERGELTYELHEPGLERLQLPALPYARLMLAARALHEWSHVADDAGWIVQTIDDDEWSARRTLCTQTFSRAMERAPRHRPLTSADANRCAADLVDGIVGRIGDFRANLLLARLADPSEREAYVRQNVRSLRSEARTGEVWSVLARYLYELQYLRFSATDDRLDTFFAGTDFEADYLASGLLERSAFEELRAAVSGLCDDWEIDPAHLRLP